MAIVTARPIADQSRAFSACWLTLRSADTGAADIETTQNVKIPSMDLVPNGALGKFFALQSKAARCYYRLPGTCGRGIEYISEIVLTFI